LLLPPWQAGYPRARGPGVIEEATERKVIAYMSSINVDPDMAVELFVLEPVDEPAEPQPTDDAAT
jgi:hypothetical protein